MTIRVVMFLSLLIVGISQLPDRWIVGCVAIAGSIYIFATQPKTETKAPQGRPAAKPAAQTRPPVREPARQPTAVRPPALTGERKLAGPPASPAAPVSPARTSAAAPVSAPAPAPAPAEIVTRTTRRIGQPLIDPYADQEREWTADEELELLDLYERCHSMTVIAQKMVIDKRQVAIRLIRLLLNPSGDIDDTESAPRDGARYESGDRAKIVASFNRGDSLEKIAFTFGRTQLGIGWQLLESAQRPVAVPDSLIVKLQERAS